MKILLSHYSAIEIKEARLEWQVSSEEFSVRGVQLPAAESLPFGITEVGFVNFETPQIENPMAAQLEVKLLDGERLIASTEQEIYVVPAPAQSGEGQLVFSPDLQEPLKKLGYSLTDDLSQARVAVVTKLDDSFRGFILRGGPVILLAENEDALQMHIPYVDIKEREDTAWQGDWASTFGWHRFEKIPTGGAVNFAFAGLTPEHIIGGFSPRDFAFNVYAGLFIGWLHRPVPTIARRSVGQGEVLISTFRLSRNLETNPLAMYLFAELMRLLKIPKDTHIDAFAGSQ